MGKLVRDLIPDIIEHSGRVPRTRQLDTHEFELALAEKLVEEADEFRRAGRNERPEELADVFEVVSCLASSLGLTIKDVAALAADKRERRGGFADRIWLE
ncbi:nucleoside triphosphate pyrophosphohydrolase [Rhodococcus sp. SORGH_AS_0301]|uniref:nucleoside triphosphate pyrophosphohydrolase n=1 Tax=Rhodococcus sp. SORGH_AS_0301 TaxID=3041780 RepID=UPI00278B93B1|nr:nucleoside triphosphate pyrophosphohydrolase [Rhodococcus sp. SORGH_AS_0301]MDQ1179238.1 putative house-cleaning noncanonical NTP pyrophosphatase (MazG superfamily) [Rhodococcus sp. SORGH_AS_0301]